jgi:hypothetical protein
VVHVALTLEGEVKKIAEGIIGGKEEEEGVAQFMDTQSTTMPAG